ncbi:hypothetical protein BDV24DRAFT_127023 [Aspergillus arachidicola]|uniref:3-phytase n=1 Tax=Aspergillus arachidicola TaxID=656916 RepID=A0A5N6YII2_9EURO|nr:hypothetical protein BDV24DRAFT_127023 [Aspergillus arachidicola]
MRRVGIGVLLGDATKSPVTRVEKTATMETAEQKLLLSGTHDSTLGAIMVSLGIIGVSRARKWPPYGSVFAVELFREDRKSDTQITERAHQQDNRNLHPF